MRVYGIRKIVIFKLLANSRDQCDQMDRLLFNIWPFIEM